MNKEKLETSLGILTFEMNFKTIKKLDQRYGHQRAIDIFDSIRDFNSHNFTDGVLKVLEVCCVDKDLEEGDLERILTPSFENIVKIDEVACKLVLGFLGNSKESDDSEKK